MTLKRKRWVAKRQRPLWGKAGTVEKTGHGRGMGWRLKTQRAPA